jgi:hypothetical protein
MTDLELFLEYYLIKKIQNFCLDNHNQVKNVLMIIIKFILNILKIFDF